MQSLPNKKMEKDNVDSLVREFLTSDFSLEHVGNVEKRCVVSCVDVTVGDALVAVLDG